MLDATLLTMSDRPQRTIGDALEQHRARAAEVLPRNDPDEIKALYRELGELIAGVVDGGEQVPVLSFPETGPVVGRLVADLRGQILDAGCGPNPVFSFMAAGLPSAKVVALDISAEIVRVAVARAAAEQIPIAGVVGDLEALPFREGVFDGCVCEDTIEHVPDDDRAVAELARVCRPGARLVIGTPNRVRLDVLRARLRDTLARRHRPASAYYAASTHLREYTWRSLERKLRPRLTVRSRASVGWTGGWRARFATTLVGFPPFRAFSRMIVVVAEPRSSR